MFTHTQITTVSYFNSGFQNKDGKAVPQNRPSRELTIEEVYHMIVSGQLKDATQAVRAEEDEKKQGEMKMLTLPYVTFFGTFTYRSNKALKKASGLMVLDIDDVDEPNRLAEIRKALINDKRYPSVLCFTSPRGHGIKDIIYVGDMDGMTLREYFQGVSRYFAFNYGIEIDPSGKDASRACYMCHDVECYINRNVINENTNTIQKHN